MWKDWEPPAYCKYPEYTLSQSHFIGGLQIKMNKFRKSRKGFTLIEIMIVVLIIGILLAIAIPNFMKARETSRTKACIANLKEIDTAKEQLAMDTHLSNGGACDMTDLVGADAYIKNTPICPSGTGAYTASVIGTAPVCPNVATNALHVLP